MTTLGDIALEEVMFKTSKGVFRPFSQSAGVKCRGYSLLLQRRVTDFGAEKSFDGAARQMKEHYGIEISASTVRRITQGHGHRLQGQSELIQGGADTSRDVAQLIAQTDGSMIPIVTRDPDYVGDQRKTRLLGWREARLGLVYEQGSATPIFGVSTDGVDQAGDQLLCCSVRLGMTDQTQVHAVGDGAAWIPEQIERIYGAQGSYLIDFYHLCEYLAEASKSCAAEHDAWYKEQKASMKQGERNAVLAALAPHLEPAGVADSDAPVRACHRYIDNRPDQFDYPKALQAGLPIGSGAIESSHRFVIQDRLKRAGAWWKLENADKMLALRTTRANGNWENYWSSPAATSATSL